MLSEKINWLEMTNIYDILSGSFIDTNDEIVTMSKENRLKELNRIKKDVLPRIFEHEKEARQKINKTMKNNIDLSDHSVVQTFSKMMIDLKETQDIIEAVKNLEKTLQ